MGSVVGNLMGSSAFEQPNLIQPTDKKQADEQYGAVTNAQANQNAFVNALQNANGVGNLSNVYNQLGNIAAGQGPNPAQAMLNQATGNNVANQAALMASQRGAGQNAGLIARQAAQTGGNLQQQAAGQGATMQANQSLNALGQMGNIANSQVGAQQSALGQQANAALGAQGNILGGIQGYNNNQTALALERSKQQANMSSNLMGAAGKALQTAWPAISKFGSGLWDSIGGMGAGAGALVTEGAPYIGDAVVDAAPVLAVAAKGGAVSEAPRISLVEHHVRYAKGGQVPALVSPGEKYLPPQAVQQVAKGANPMSVGETIPGKAKVEGAKDSYANDTVPKKLDQGGIVLPRSVTKSKNPDKAAEAFVDAILKRNRLRK